MVLKLQTFAPSWYYLFETTIILYFFSTTLVFQFHLVSQKSRFNKNEKIKLSLNISIAAITPS